MRTNRLFDASRRQFLWMGPAGVAAAVAASACANETRVNLIETITKRVLDRGKQTPHWFHPRACRVPRSGLNSSILMNLQEIGGSDYFGQVHWMQSDDLGETWTDPQPIPALGRDPVPGKPGLAAGVCDVTPQYHPPTQSVLALGHVVFYKGPRFSRGDQLSRYPVYVVRDKAGDWGERKVLSWDDPRGRFIYSNNCGQRVVMPNGDIMMSFTFGPTEKNRMVAGVRCTFDGSDLEIAEVGPPLENRVGRGLLEPSIVRFGGRFYMTIRAEDDHGYVAVSDDGVRYDQKKAWSWDDARPLAMSTTQQHWLAHSDGLFLVYTRKDASNTNVTRWRSPLWIARVDTEKMVLIRDSEQIVLPMVGDGIHKPDEVSLMGNFDVTNINQQKSWITVGDWVPKSNLKGNLLASEIQWTQPNRLVDSNS